MQVAEEPREAPIRGPGRLSEGPWQAGVPEDVAVGGVIEDADMDGLPEDVAMGGVIEDVDMDGLPEDRQGDLLVGMTTPRPGVSPAAAGVKPPRRSGNAT